MQARRRRAQPHQNRPAGGGPRRGQGRGHHRRRRRRGGNRPARHAPPGRRARRDPHRHQPRRGPDRDRSGAAVRVVIAEDNALLREGLVLLLTSAGHEVVAVAAAEPEILPALLAHRPDIAVLDVRMPPNFRDEGLRAALAARRQIPGLPVLVLSQYVEEAYAAELLGGGASGIGSLLKARVGRVEEFLDALDRVAAGGTALDPEVVTELLARRRSTPLDSLTPREREGLKLVAESHDNTTIAATLVITERSVSKHIGNVFLKLGLPSTDVGHRRVLAVLAHLNNATDR